MIEKSNFRQGLNKKNVLRSKTIASNYVAFEIKNNVGFINSIKSIFKKQDNDDCIEYRLYKGKRNWLKSKNKKHSKSLFSIALEEALGDEEFAKKYYELKQ